MSLPATLRARRSALGDDSGSAMVEFCYLAVLLLVPLAYGILTLFQLQKGAYAVSSASREAGRAFLVATDSAAQGGGGQGGYAAALAAARIAAADHGLDLGPDSVHLGCSPDPACPLTPGQRVEVRVDVAVPLPLMPRVLAGAFPASVAVSGHHVEIVEDYRASARARAGTGG